MEGEREGEKHQCVVASHAPPTGDLARSPGKGPDWESTQRPCGLPAGAQSTEPHQPGPEIFNSLVLLGKKTLSKTPAPPFSSVHTF